MSKTKFNPEDMPILSLNAADTSRYEASRFLDSPKAMAAYLSESMKNGDTEGFVHALAEVAKAKGVNQVAKDAGVNRESLYKVLKSGAKTRFETIRKLMNAIGVELTVQPIAAFAGGPQSAAAKAHKPAAAKSAAKPAVAKPAAKSAVAKSAAKPAVAKPAAKPAAAKPAVKPAVAKAAVKPAVAKPAVPKPSASGVHSPTAPAEPQAIPANKRMATDSVLELSR